ncbi:unnamed protein product [Rotaria socialis]|uniref:F-box domain-containing protein n=1 Tax=Rotaria socialis TaxID=392032 RepID=A0A820RVN0_9BILA|nr:unnamed protein product [Rotaria socialis]CAF4442162.1 unnamed protein product [Rotaria socialis]
MNQSYAQLQDLPDELLIFIFKQMHNVEVLYSLFGVNERLNSILLDPIFTNCLNFLKWSSKNFLNIYSLDIIFDRFCLQILPAVHEKIQWLDVESSSMKRILCAADYPNLHGLGLFNIEEETIKSLFIDINLSSGLFQNQITKLLITIDSDQYQKHDSTMEYICNHIFSVFKKLTHLIFSESSYQNIVTLPFYPPINFCSPSLVLLNIKIDLFVTCLCLLDGRFSQLHTLIVESANISASGKIENQLMRIKNEIILPSKEYIQKPFKNFPHAQIICYMDRFLDRGECQYHIFTYPSQISYYQYLSNQFPGGYYPYVRMVSLFDEYPFEHEFFLQITQSFPFIEKLVLINREPQKHKQSSKSENDNCHLSIVKYSHLIELNIERVYDDYVEEFLSETKTFFQNNIRLRIASNALLRVTKNFTRKDTRMNCIKVEDLLPWGEFRSSKSFQEYFLSIKESGYITSFFI